MGSENVTQTQSSTTQQQSVVGDLDENVAGVLCYFFGFISGGIFYLIEDNNDFVRFHAMQSIIVFGGLFLINIAISLFAGLLAETVPVVGFVFGLLASLGSLALSPIMFILWVVLMYKAYNGSEWELPVVGGIARSQI